MSGTDDATAWRAEVRGVRAAARAMALCLAGASYSDASERDYCAWTSQPRYMSASTASVTNAVAWRASAKV
jgi:hypothetical protein